MLRTLIYVISHEFVNVNTFFKVLLVQLHTNEQHGVANTPRCSEHSTCLTPIRRNLTLVCINPHSSQLYILDRSAVIKYSS